MFSMCLSETNVVKKYCRKYVLTTSENKFQFDNNTHQAEKLILIIDYWRLVNHEDISRCKLFYYTRWTIFKPVEAIIMMRIQVEMFADYIIIVFASAVYN